VPSASSPNEDEDEENMRMFKTIKIGKVKQ
jgi:hypothetical protein